MSFVSAELPPNRNGLRAPRSEEAAKSNLHRRNVIRSMRWLVVSAVFCLTLFSVSLARGLEPSTHISQYGHAVWRLGQNGLDGLPNTIAQSADGYLWIGTADGLLRFDGVRFTRWVPPAGESLPDPSVRSLLGTRDGSLYIGTDHGLTRLTHGHLYNYPEKLRSARALLEDQTGDIWTGDWGDSAASNTFCKVGETHLNCLGMKDGLGCMFGYALVSDKPGSVWIGSLEGICRWRQNGKPENYLMPSLPESNHPVHAIAIDKQGSLWAGILDTGPDRGLLKFSDGAWKTYITPEVDGRKFAIRALWVDRGGSLWIGTDVDGLYRLTIASGKLDHFGSKDGLSGSSVKQITEDREGTVWVITDRGVDSFHDLPVISFTEQQGLSDDTPNAVTTMQNGDVWVATANALNRFSKDRFSTWNPSHSNDRINYLFADSHDQLWVAQGEKLYRYNNGRFSAVTGEHGETLGRVIELTEDNQHQVWASTEDRGTGLGNLLFRIDGLHVAEKINSTAIAGGQILNILVPNPHGGLWIGGIEHGLYWFHEGKPEQVAVNELKSPITDMTQDPDGLLWITTQHGIILYKDGGSRKLTDQNGLPCNVAYNILKDQAGSHWLYMACGIVKVSDTELIHSWRDPNYRIQTTLLDSLDGAMNRLLLEGPSRGPDGRLWSINGSALQMIDPTHLHYNSLSPPVQIQHLLVDHIEHAAEGGLKLPATPREVQIDYAGLSYVIPERVRFRYQLLGHDKDWTDAGTRKQAFYNDLPPGHYTFHVIACNNDGVWNLRGATLDFIVPPIWFQTLWFRLLCVALATTVVYFIYQLRMRQYAARMKMRFNERLEERTRLARDLHDTLMQTIQGSRIVAENAYENTGTLESAKSALGLLSEWLGRATLEGRAALDSLRSSTREENDLAAAFRHSFDNYIKDDTMTVNLCVTGKSREMHPIARDEVYRIGDEAIRNACLHSEGKRLHIELVYDENMELRVHDDGKGIDAETLEAGKTGHYGLTGMRERASRIGATLSVQSSPQGTEIVLSVPGKAIYQRPSA